MDGKNSKNRPLTSRGELTERLRLSPDEEEGRLRGELEAEFPPDRMSDGRSNRDRESAHMEPEAKAESSDSPSDNSRAAKSS